MFAHILVAVDFDRSSQRALDTAARLALESGARLTLVHADDTAVIAAASTGLAVADFVSPVQLADADQMRSLVESVRARGVAQVDGFVREEAPVPGVLATARAISADLIVVGTHGRRGVDRLLLGSVAEGVLRGAEVPVLVVKGER